MNLENRIDFCRFLHNSTCYFKLYCVVLSKKIDWRKIVCSRKNI